LYFLRQLISDTLNINYRLVSALGHLIAGIAKILYMLLSSVGLAVYDFVSHVLLAVAGIFSFVIDCLYFVLHCCTLLFRIIYYTVTGVADGLGFVLLMPICACQTIHSWIMWIFNTEHWLNAAVWCLRTCSHTFSLVGENTWWLIQYLVTAIISGISTVATFTYINTELLCSTMANGFISLCAAVTEGTIYIFISICNFIMWPFNFVYDCSLTMLQDSVHRLLQPYTNSYLCLIPTVLSVVVMLVFRGNRLTRFLRRCFRHSTGEVIRINFHNLDDAIEVSDDEEDYFQGHAFAEDDQEDDMEAEDTDDESDIADSSDEMSEDTSVSGDSISDDSDREAIDVQLPDQPTTSLVTGRQHGYATRSKGNVDHHQVQERVDQERERSLCVICQDQVKSVLVLPCRHMCMCVDCARTVVSGSHGQRRICPLCRGDIRIVMNVYT